MEKEIKITKKAARRGDDGYKVVSVRMKEEMIDRLGEEEGRIVGQTPEGGRNAEAGAAWQKEVQAAFPEHTVPSISLPLSICCHTGEGALGVACAKQW